MSERDALEPDQRAALACVLDEIIPASADGRLPGAGELGLAERIGAALLQHPEQREPIIQGLAALHGLVAARGTTSLSALSAADRAAALGELASQQPAFVPVLVLHTYSRYYEHPRVLEALGLEPRPPHPLGYSLEAGDLTLLDPVRDRGKRYRDC